jgi:hypothetical protein
MALEPSGRHVWVNGVRPYPMTRPDYGLAKFSKLRIDRARDGPAPHKPLLLLVLCDLVEKESLSHGVLPLSPELAFRFYTYWSIVAERRPQRPDVRLPFHHLSAGWRRASAALRF